MTWVLITLMCFSVLGLIYIQFYWINEAYHLKEQDFRKQVGEALDNISKRIQQEEVIKTMKSQASSRVWLNSQKGDAESNLQSGIEDYAWFRNQSTKLSDLEFGFSIEESNNGFFSIEDSIEPDPSLKLKYSFEISEPDKNLKNLLASSPNSQLKLIEEVIKQLNTKKAPATRIPRNHLVHVVRQELERANILLAHQFILSEEPAKKVIHQSDDKLSIAQLYRSRFRVRLFPDDVINEELLLYLRFPQQNKQLLQRLAHMLIGSFILILFIIGCFIYAVGVIKKQSKLSDMKTDFINNMTHEFKTPIATISLASEALTEKTVLEDQSKTKRFVKVIFDENSRLKNQVEKVLQFAKIDKGEWQLQKITMNLHQTLEEMAQSFSLQIQEKQGTLKLDLKAKRSDILADPVHIKNIFSNLIDNASKYCEQDPEIKIKTASSNKGITVSVEDNGIGMTKEEQQRIFEKFYRVTQGNIHDVKGFGLGLSYVNTMVQAHQGYVKVKSQKSKGSTFEIFIPFTSKSSEYEH